MEYITTKEASAKWGISTIRITVLANEGRIPGAQRLGRSWLIPASATKPQELKPNHRRPASEARGGGDFSYPLYHFRPDWSYINEERMTEQERVLLSAETAVLECRFDEGYSMLGDIMQSPDSIAIEIGSLWSAGICCIALNKPEEFSKVLLRLQMLMSDEFPHRDDMVVVLDSLKTYTQNLTTIANEYTYRTDIHDQCLPTACLLAGYSQLSKETIMPGTTDINLLELNLRFIHGTGAVIVAEFMHIYMAGIYYLRNDMQRAEQHARDAVRLAYENGYYFPIVTYYLYTAPVLAPIIDEYPQDFRNRCIELATAYDENMNAFISSTSEYKSLSMLKDTDFPYIYAVLMNLSNDEIAQRMNVSPRTAKRRLDAIFKTLNVSNKKELKQYLQHNV